MKFIVLSIIACSVFIIVPRHILAQTQSSSQIQMENNQISPAEHPAEHPVSVYLFYGDGCPHCAKERQFLDEVLRSQPNVSLYEYEIYKNKEHREILSTLSKKYQIETNGVPILFIGETTIVGYTPNVTSKEIIEQIRYCSMNECNDKLATHIPPEHRVAKTITLPTSDMTIQQEMISKNLNTKEKTATLPLIGSVELSALPLPLLTITLAFLDGFNPCAMWILLFLISLLLGLHDKKRMWFLGSLFILSSSIVYFLFLSAWLNVFLLVGVIAWVRVLIGFAALIAGVVYLRDYHKNKAGTCSIMGNEKRKHIFDRLKEITLKKSLFLASIGIITLSVGVNIVELVCSAGLPAIYTQVLSLSQIPTWQYYLYLLLYIVVFMLDDFVVFATAMITLQSVGIQGKYARYSHFIGGVLMLLIGILLIFYPEALMFG